MPFSLYVFDFGFSHLCIQVKLEGDISQGVAYYKKALYYNWHYADAMYNLGVAYGEMLKFEMVNDLWEFFLFLSLHAFVFLFLYHNEIQQIYSSLQTKLNLEFIFH